MPRPERPRRSARPTQPARRRLLVVCCGQTESRYLGALWRKLGDARLAVTIKVRSQSPAQLVEYAGRLAGHGDAEFDELWCVVDVDDYDIRAACALAARNGTELVVSNPCFEFWLLLHFENCETGLLGAREAMARLRRHRPDFDKARLAFTEYEAGVDKALVRARALDRTGTEPPNPSTGVWRLVARLRGEPG